MASAKREHIEDILCPKVGNFSHPLLDDYLTPTDVLIERLSPPQMALIKSKKSRQSTHADAGSHICDSCGTSIRNRGKKQHKCNGNGGTSLGDVYKEMAEQEALERGMFNIIFRIPLVFESPVRSGY